MLPLEVGGGYMAGLEVFHQLHCVVSESPVSLGLEKIHERMG